MIAKVLQDTRLYKKMMQLKAKAKSTFENKPTPELTDAQVNTKHGSENAKNPKKEPLKNVRFDDGVVKDDKIDKNISESETSDSTQDDTIQDDEISDEAMNEALDEAANKQLCSEQEMDVTHPSKPDQKTSA